MSNTTSLPSFNLGLKDSEPHWAYATHENAYFAYWVGERQRLRWMDHYLNTLETRLQRQEKRVDAITEELQGKLGKPDPDRMVSLMIEQECLQQRMEKRRAKITKINNDLLSAQINKGWRVENLWHERPVLSSRRPDSAMVLRSVGGLAFPHSPARPQTAMAGQYVAMPAAMGESSDPSTHPNFSRPRTATGHLNGLENTLPGGSRQPHIQDVSSASRNMHHHLDSAYDADTDSERPRRRHALEAGVNRPRLPQGSRPRPASGFW